MAVKNPDQGSGKKTVAAPATLASIPLTASSIGELEAVDSVTVAQDEDSSESSTADTVHAAQLARLEKARAAKAAKAAAKQKAALDSVSSIQSVLAAEKANDHLSFGTIREVARTVPTAEEYVKVEIPNTDLFDHSHPGVQLNRHRFEPGKTYLLRGDVALEVKRRLAMFHDEQVRLLRPNADRKALNDVNRGSQWTNRGSSVHALGSLEDVPVAADERIYTVDF